MPGNLGQLGAELSGPFRVASQTFFGKIEFSGASGNSNGWWGDSTQRVMIWNPQMNVEWQPPRNRDWRVSLHASQRGSRFNWSRLLPPLTDTTPSKDSSWDVHRNNLRFNPRITWQRVSQRTEGLYQNLVLEGFGTGIWNSSNLQPDQYYWGSEWSSLMAYQIGYRQVHSDWGLKVGWSGSSFYSGTKDALDKARNTISFKPSWAGDLGVYRVIASVNLLRQREQEDSSISLRSSWLILPELVLQYRKPTSAVSGFREPLMLEFGISSGILQPSLYHWSSTYPTLSAMDAYQASVNRAEGFVRLEHSAGSGWQWQHRIGLSSWTNARFFELDSNSALGVSSLRLPHATRLSLETRVHLKEQSQMQASFSSGMQGILSQSYWNGMPGLQPVLWGTLHLSRFWRNGWQFDFESTVYAVDSKRMVSNDIIFKGTSLKWPLNLDLSLTKSVLRSSSLAFSFRQRQSAPFLRWAEDVIWGRLLQVEWRWKI
jgi:hypothetical protein